MKPKYKQILELLEIKCNTSFNNKKCLKNKLKDRRTYSMWIVDEWSRSSSNGLIIQKLLFIEIFNRGKFWISDDGINKFLISNGFYFIERI